MFMPQLAPSPSPALLFLSIDLHVPPGVFLNGGANEILGLVSQGIS
jgi:hypothetical protein